MDTFNIDSATEKTATEKIATEKIATEKTATEKTATEKTAPIKKKKRRLKLTVKRPKSGIQRAKTLKSKDIEAESTIPVMQQSSQDKGPPLNDKFIALMEELETIYRRAGDFIRGRVYAKAAEAIIGYDAPITSVDQLKGTPNIGPKILEKLQTYQKTGTLPLLEKERANPVNELTRVYDLGAVRAKKLVAMGIQTIPELKEAIQKKPDLVTRNIKLGLEYYDDIEKRIPRSTIDSFNKIFEKTFNEVAFPASTFEIVGSYRRGKQTSGDIDIIITDKTNASVILSAFVDRLKEKGIIVDTLTMGTKKSHGLARIPDDPTVRRVDFMYSPPNEYSFAILYFTGSKAFNIAQRNRALYLGYSLNEKGLFKIIGKKKTERVMLPFPTEDSIFKFLGMEYVQPTERINANSITLTENPDVNINMESDAVKTRIAATEARAKKTTKKTSVNKIISKTSQVVSDTAAPDTAAPDKTTRTAKKHTIKIRVKKTTHIADFKKTGVSLLKTLTERDLSKMIRSANKAYYCNQEPLMTDNQYDILREYTLSKYPKNKAAVEGHTKCSVKEIPKVKLPFEMWSMDKIKPDTKALSKWINTYSGPYVLSCKLDGVSGLYTTTDGTKKLYTRGDGIEGQDISHILPYLRLPETPDIAIRGELIMQKNTFAEKYADKYANPRNFVAGLVNTRSPNPAHLADLEFVAYELINPSSDTNEKPSKQMAFLESQDIETVYNIQEDVVSNELLSELLTAWRSDYKFEIDGVICTNDEAYKRVSGNPKYAFAFKMVLSDQIAEAKVLDVIWTASKNGKLKPRVQIEPVTIGGVKIEFATGKNAKMIVENKIGVGALVKIIRAGDVIPDIVDVVQPADEPQMPTVPYVWNETHVDILLKDPKASTGVTKRQILHFLKTIGVTRAGPGMVTQLVKLGFNKTALIASQTKEELYDALITAKGIETKTASHISNQIHDKLRGENAVSMATLMYASSIYQTTSIGLVRFKLILDTYPDILTSDISKTEKIDMIENIDGIGSKIAEAFVEDTPEFITWLEESRLEDRLSNAKTVSASKAEIAPTINTSHPLYDKKIIMTGTRDADLLNKLKDIGAKIQTAVSKKTDYIIAKDPSKKTGKLKNAEKMGIPQKHIFTKKEFLNKFF